MNILQLPLEVQHCIISWLGPLDLAATTRVHSGLRAPAEMVLYTDIRFKWLAEPNDPPRYMHLLRSLIDRPELGKYIRSIELGQEIGLYLHSAWSLNNCRVKFIDVVPVHLADLNRARLCSSLVVSAGVPSGETEEWIQAIETGNAEAIIALIVALAPKITKIIFSCFRTSGKWEYLAQMFKQTISRGLEENCPRFPLLKHIRLKPNLHENNPHPSSNAPDLLSLFYLKNIESLSIPIPSRETFNWPMASAPAPSKLSHLKLYRIREHRGLRTILSVCPALKSFRFKWIHHPDFDQPFNSSTADLDEIADAILNAPCRNKLINLRFDPTCKFRRDWDTWNQVQPPPIVVRGSLSFLSQLTNLEVLMLPWVFMVGMSHGPLPPSNPGFIASHLPRNIIQFILADDFPTSDNYYWEQDEIIAALMADLRNSNSFAACPRLEVLTVPRETRRSHQGAFADPDFRMRDIRQLCNFRVEWLDNPLGSHAWEYTAHETFSSWDRIMRSPTREEREELERLEEEAARLEAEPDARDEDVEMVV